jgi:hypothetical protein
MLHSFGLSEKVKNNSAQNIENNLLMKEILSQ